METFLEIIKVVVPVSIVCFTFYFLSKEFFENETEKRRMEQKKELAKSLLPLKLQAYERVIIFLERIAPENMIIRTHKSGMSAKLFHSELSKAIRTEYEHNLSQQLYMSETAWELVKNSKEEMQKLYNLASSKMEDGATGIDLSHVIFQMAAQLDKLPSQVAIDYIKKEIKASYNL